MMKKSAIVFMGIILSVLSCNRDELNEKKPIGTLKVDIGLYVTVSEISENLKSTWGPEDFKVVIYNSADQEVIKFERAADMPDAIQLETGNYYVIVFSDNDLPAAFNNPYYYGKSEVFTIAPNDHRTVVVNCEQGNTAVSVVYSDNIRNYFDDFTTKVSSSAGSLDFGRDETRTGYFRPLPLTINATLTLQKADGTLENKVLTGMITTPLPKRKYEIHVNASAGGGSSILTINLDESAGPVEIVDISEETQDNKGVLENGELLITEIMYDPTAQSDAAGEWFEIFNNTNHPVNLKNLVVEKNETEHHVISDSITLSPGNYQVLARSETALTGDKYVYGSSIALNNTGAMLSVSNYGTDGTDGGVICSVNYGAQGFSSASGASLCLDPDHLNVLDASAGTSWCVSSSVYNTGDMGTPGGANDSCD